MKALSIHATWAWAIMFAGKDVENRSWLPPKALIGERFWIHASRWGTDDQVYDEFFEVNDCIARGPSRFKPTAPLTLRDVRRMKGHILGSVRLVGVVTNSGPAEFVSPWFFGPVGFVLADPRPLTVPVPCKGKLGFFEVEPASDEMMRAAT